MSFDSGVREKLRGYLAEVEALPAEWAKWSEFETWAAKVRPFLRRNFDAGDVKDFDNIVKRPEWTSSPAIAGPGGGDSLRRAHQHDVTINNQKVLGRKEQLSGFLNTLIELTGGGEPPQTKAVDAGERTMPDPKRVFVIYGRNSFLYDQMVLFLRALDLRPKGFFEVAAECGAHKTVLDIVKHGMTEATGVVALFTPDEWSVLRPGLDPARGQGEESRRWQARPNVIFEAGLALGIAPERTVLVTVGREVRVFSDVAGYHLVKLDNQPESRNYLRGKLKAAGCDVDMGTGEHLHTKRGGDFESGLSFDGETPPSEPFVAPKATARPRSRRKKDAPSDAESELGEVERMMPPRTRALFRLQAKLSWAPVASSQKVQLELQVRLANDGTATAKDICMRFVPDVRPSKSGDFRVGTGWGRDAEQLRKSDSMHPGAPLSLVFTHDWQEDGATQTSAEGTSLIPYAPTYGFKFAVLCENQLPQYFEARFNGDELRLKKVVVIEAVPCDEKSFDADGSASFKRRIWAH